MRPLPANPNWERDRRLGSGPLVLSFRDVNPNGEKEGKKGLSQVAPPLSELKAFNYKGLLELVLPNGKAFTCYAEVKWLF